MVTEPSPVIGPSRLDDSIDMSGGDCERSSNARCTDARFRLTCPACGPIRLLDAIPLWWLFARGGWDDGLPTAIRKLCCEPCREAGRIVPPDYIVTREQPEGPQRPYSERREWNRIVSRYRS